MEEEEREGGFELVGEESYLSNQNSFNELTPFSPLEPEEEITQLKWYYEERISLPSPLFVFKTHLLKKLTKKNHNNF